MEVVKKKLFNENWVVNRSKKKKKKKLLNLNILLTNL